MVTWLSANIGNCATLPGAVNTVRGSSKGVHDPHSDGWTRNKI